MLIALIVNHILYALFSDVNKMQNNEKNKIKNRRRLVPG